jgi:hypothetical protein
MRERMPKLLKQVGRLLWIELVVPGGTLVVLTILLARVFAAWRSRRLALLVPTTD